MVQFVRSDEVDPLYFERSYYVGPEEQAGKPYQLFVQTLLETKYHALAKLTMHGREHVVLIRPNDGILLLHTLYYPNELRAANRPALSTQTKPAPKEMELAKSLVQHLAAPFDPSEFHDAYRENVERLIEQKQKGRKISLVPPQKRAPVIDLMEALKKSLAAAPARAPKAKVAAPAAKKSRKTRAA